MTPPEFGEAVLGRHRANLAKWGEQNVDVLLSVLVEEIGEVATALLGEGDLQAECIDAAAVLMDFACRIAKVKEGEE